MTEHAEAPGDEGGADPAATLRQILDVRRPATMTAANTAAAAESVRHLTARRLLDPVLLDMRGWQSPVRFAAMAAEADRAVISDGVRHNGKWNAPVGDEVSDFVDQEPLLSRLQQATAVELSSVLGATFIAYSRPGEHLAFHVDGTGFGALNVLLCLRHRRTRRAGSKTLFLRDAELVAFDLDPGVAVLFDGVATPHARTPLDTGEEVVLVSFGLSVAA